MARREPPKRSATNRTGPAGDEVRGALERYRESLEDAPLALRTRQAYAAHVAAYASWLAPRPKAGAALHLPRARDLAARDFKRMLKLERGWKPSSVNLALSAVDHFNRFLGLGAANVTREPVAQATPRALSVEEQRALLRAAEETRARDRAIVSVLLNTALRLSELVALNSGDVRLSARKGVLVVWSGKGDLYREIALNRTAREALDAWLSERAVRVSASEQALFIGPRGKRLGPRAVDMVVRRAGQRAGLKLSAHVLRHTCVTNLVRAGHDVVLVAEIAGHRRLETTRRYSLPSAADREAAMASLEIED